MAYFKGYTCIGKVRGACGVNHRSIRMAAACTAKDHAACLSAGATHSDRRPRVALSDGTTNPVPEALSLEFDALRIGALYTRKG